MTVDALDPQGKVSISSRPPPAPPGVFDVDDQTPTKLRAPDAATSTPKKPLVLPPTPKPPRRGDTVRGLAAPVAGLVSSPPDSPPPAPSALRSPLPLPKLPPPRLPGQRSEALAALKVPPLPPAADKPRAADVGKPTTKAHDESELSWSAPPPNVTPLPPPNVTPHPPQPQTRSGKRPPPLPNTEVVTARPRIPTLPQFDAELEPPVTAKEQSKPIANPAPLATPIPIKTPEAFSLDVPPLGTAPVENVAEPAPLLSAPAAPAEAVKTEAVPVETTRSRPTHSEPRLPVPKAPAVNKPVVAPIATETQPVAVRAPRSRAASWGWIGGLALSFAAGASLMLLRSPKQPSEPAHAAEQPRAVSKSTPTAEQEVTKPPAAEISTQNSPAPDTKADSQAHPSGSAPVKSTSEPTPRSVSQQSAPSIPPTAAAAPPIPPPASPKAVSAPAPTPQVSESKAPIAKSPASGPPIQPSLSDTRSSGAKPVTPAGEAGEFDRAAAVSGLQNAAAEASGCRQPGDPSGTATVVITFAPSGRVTSATVSGPPFAGTPTGGCIASTMRRVRIPAFSGDKTTVSKTVVIN